MRTIDELGISPAPWFINNDEYGDTNEVLCQYNLDGVIHTKTLARTNSHFKSSEHDARLIAAAPELYQSVCDLLEICGNIGEYIGVDCGTIEKIDNAKAALAKASGVEAK